MVLLGAIVAIIALPTLLVGLPVYLLACRFAERPRPARDPEAIVDAYRPRRHRL